MQAVGLVMVIKGTQACLILFQPIAAHIENTIHYVTVVSDGQEVPPAVVAAPDVVTAADKHEVDTSVGLPPTRNAKSRDPFLTKGQTRQVNRCVATAVAVEKAKNHGDDSVVIVTVAAPSVSVTHGAGSRKDKESAASTETRGATRHIPRIILA